MSDSLTPDLVARLNSVSSTEIATMYELTREAARRIAELEQRLKRINAINDNPARFDAEIDELSKVTT